MAIILPISGDPGSGSGGNSPPDFGGICLSYIGWQNKIESAVLIGSASAGGDARNGIDSRPYTRWEWGSGAVNEFEFEFAEETRIDYLAAAFYSLGGTGLIRLDYFDPDTEDWINVMTIDEAVTQGRPRMSIFSGVEALKWRIQVEPGDTTAPYVGVLYAGEWLGIPTQEVGWTPPRLARDTKLLSNVSESGVFLGKSFVRSASEFEITANFLRADWAYSSWLAFIKHAEQKPFFFFWDIGVASDSVFCWTEEKIDPPEFAGPYHVDASITVRGVCE